jgi:hypothetical protein
VHVLAEAEAICVLAHLDQPVEIDERIHINVFAVTPDRIAKIAAK